MTVGLAWVGDSLDPGRGARSRETTEHLSGPADGGSRGGERVARPERGAATARAATGTLVRAAAAGEREAFGALYASHVRAVHGVLLAHVDRDDVHDLVQDVFLTALEQLHTLREPDAFPGWLLTIARNRARMHHRAARPSESLPDDLVSPAAPPDRALEAGEVMRALRALPERYREPLALRLVEGMSGEEIAQRTGLTHGTVRVYLHHGLTLLRASLGGADA